MASQLSVIILGQRGVGKSTFGNILLGLGDESKNRFIVNSEDTEYGRMAVGCARFCERVQFNSTDGDPNPQIMQLEIIDTPGLDAPNTEGYQHKWRDLVHAFDMCKDKKVATFILLLKANDGKNGEKVVKTFVDMYGHESLARCLVVFTYNNTPFLKNAMRHIQIEHFEYLLQLLKPGFPYHVWRTDLSRKNQRREILKMIEEISDHNQYTKDHFTKAQEIYTLKMVKHFQTEERLSSSVTKDELQRLGVPDILFGRYLPNRFLS